MTQITATVSGSFTRHLVEIQRAVAELTEHGVRVLSPEQPTIVETIDGFVFVASDRHRSVKLVQDRHLASIAHSDFLWLEDSDGYVGQSAALEIGFAIGLGIPVYSCSLPTDLTMRQYVRRVPSIATAVSLASTNDTADATESSSLLVDPWKATDEADLGVSRIRGLLTRKTGAEKSEALYRQVSNERKKVIRALRLPESSRS